MPTSTPELKNLLARRKEIELTVVGRKSGRKSSRPVWFVLEGDTLYLLPVTGSDTEWYKNILQNPKISISVGGVQAELEASPVTDPKAVLSVVEKFRSKHGAADVRKYYSKLDVAAVVKIS